MANWRCTVEAYDLAERVSKGDLMDYPVAQFLADLGDRVWAAAKWALIIDTDLEDILQDIEGGAGWYIDFEDLYEILERLWDWGDVGHRMFINTAFPARVTA